jgi:hypothetical protein
LPPHEEAVCYPPGWTPYPTNLVYLDRAIALAESRGIPVFYLIPPIHPGVQLGRERRGLDAAFVGLVEKIRSRYKNVVVVDGRHAGFGHGVFADSHHLTADGAAALSAGLADTIATRLDRPGDGERWVSLPPFREPGAKPPIEDMDESRMALARQAERR